MEKCPQSIIESSGLTIKEGYSFRVIPVDDKPKTNTTTVLKPEVTMSEQNPSTKITPVTTKKPIKL